MREIIGEMWTHLCSLVGVDSGIWHDRGIGHWRLDTASENSGTDKRADPHRLTSCADFGEHNDCLGALASIALELRELKLLDAQVIQSY